MNASNSKVWFITGASRGFGLETARDALARGDKVVATARNPQAIVDVLGPQDNLLAVDADAAEEDQEEDEGEGHDDDDDDDARQEDAHDDWRRAPRAKASACCIKSSCIELPSSLMLFMKPLSSSNSQAPLICFIWPIGCGPLRPRNLPRA